MDFVISVRFFTSLCKDLSKTAICCCLRGAFPSNRSELPQTRKRNHPRHREMDTCRLNEVKTPQHDGTPRSHIVKTLNSSFSRRCRVPMRMSASKASKEAMMDSRRLVVSSAASCLLSWRLAVFIFLAFYSGLLGEAAPLACWLLCEGVEHVLVGIRASRARRVDHNAGLACSRLAGFACRAALRQAAGGCSRPEACRGEASLGGGCGNAAECSRETQLAPLYTSKLQKSREQQQHDPEEWPRLL